MQIAEQIAVSKDKLQIWTVEIKGRKSWWIEGAIPSFVLCTSEDIVPQFLRMMTALRD